MNYNKLLILVFLFGTFFNFAQDTKKLDSIKKVIDESSDGIDYIVEDSGINSGLNEIGSAFFRNKYIIVSNKAVRQVKVTKHRVTKTPNNNLYCVDIEENRSLKNPLLFSYVLNSKRNESSICFTPNQNTIYYTQEHTSNNQNFMLLKADLNEKKSKKWVNITNLNVVTPEYSVETPWVSPDGKKIYVSSNKLGGYGGFDLYVAPILADGKIGELVNLGAEINTSSDEKYPYVSDDNKYLYFSSKGHTNIGGYDIFRSSIVKDKYLSAYNLGTKLNSTRDDIAYIMTSPTKGYISSEKNDLGKYDILKFETKQANTIEEEFLIVEETSNIGVPDCDIIVNNEFGATVLKTKSDEKGNVSIKLNPLTEYTVTTKKEGYKTKITKLIKGVGLKKITLKPNDGIFTNDEDVTIETIYYDLNDANIKEEYKPSLNKVIEVLNDYTNISIKISSHTDSRGSDYYNQKLSERRAKSTYKYLITNGADPSRVLYEGYAGRKPLVKCKKCTEEQYRKNRRSEFTIIIK